MKLRVALFVIGGALAAVFIPVAPAPAQNDSFEKSVQPVLKGTCSGCHNAKMASGGLNLAEVTEDSIQKNPEVWRKVLRRVQAGEMPPPGVPKPAQLNGMTAFLSGRMAAIDKAAPIDPGRVTAHRLNRNEYTNTIRDLLSVDYRADKNFPADDSSGGFDNISDVLTISPVLMEKYMKAAGEIAARAVGADPLPKPIQIEYLSQDRRIRRVGTSAIEATHRVDFDADYDVRIPMPGERADGAPVQLTISMDGQVIHSEMVETKPSGLIYFNPYSEFVVRLTLPAGDHVFRAAFVNDEFIQTLGKDDFYNRKKNKYVDGIVFTGPFPSAAEKPSRKKILVCDPATGRACVEQIISTLARRAYRRPVTAHDTTSLVHFVELAQQEGQSVEQGIQLAVQAMLVSPNFLFRVERDPAPNDPTKIHKVTDVELASRLSYFLWSSMPDDELLSLAEAGRLSERATLDAQVKRMLADERSAAFAANFAGQWLETRNLDSVKPDPQKFPTWNATLRDAMKEETRLFFDYVLRQNQPISDFLSARYTFLNETLAKHYGIDGVTGSKFRRVELATDQRGGILSQASVLTVSSYPNRTSPVIRGKYVLTNILGTPPPPPPPDVPPLDDSKVGTEASMREQLQMHRANAVCAACHSKMDPLGFGLENYDAIGRWREKDGSFTIDSTGVLPNGKSFTTPAEMRDVLSSQLPEFSRALIERMLTYALGRGVKDSDARTIDGIQQAVGAQQYKFQAVIYEIVRSLPFQQRRGEGSEEKRP